MEEYLNEIALSEKVAKPKSGDCPYTLFLGAGASVSSGIPSANGMIREWQQLLYKSLNRIRKIDDESKFDEWIKKEYKIWKVQHQTDEIDRDYSFLFSHFYQQPKERQLFIEQIVEDKKPTFGYLYLAGLIADNRFNRILTTNFDDLLNDALTKYYNIKPIVCAFDSAVAGIRVASQRPKIIKLHGEFLYDNIRNMKHELKSLDSNMEEKLYEMCKDFGLIVVGYSGDDESIMAPLRDMIRKPEYLNMGLHWCIYQPREEEKEKIPPKLKELKNYHSDRVHIYMIKSFDCLMEEMFLACKSKLPKVLTDPHRNSPPKEFYESVRDASTEELTSYMRNNLNLFMEMAATQIDTMEYNVIQADLKWELGAEARKKGNLRRAKQLFTAGYELLEKFVQNKSSYPLGLKIKALRRQSGLCIGLAKISKDKNSKEWDGLLSKTLKIVDEGITLYNTPAGASIPMTIKSSFPYNGCCAYSLLSEWKNELPEQAKVKIFEFLKEIKKFDPEGEHIQKLVTDDDFSFVYKKLKSEIKSQLAI
ncbi:MAG: SIR2 family NAD-dependent protein deacylase [Methanosarcinaceae archaeon]